MGHALNNTLQDILVRFERMRGRDVLWQPGTDHAGIATQMVVERQLAGAAGARPPRPGPRRLRRAGLGVEGGIGRRRSSTSCSGSAPPATGRASASPWTRACRAAVRKVFVELYQARADLPGQAAGQLGPEAAHAISDLEVEQVEVKGHLWHLRYPLEGRAFDPTIRRPIIVVATTRPETMLGDTAVAVHPDDERYRRSGRQACASCRWSAAASRSSPTNIPIPRRAPARSRSRPAHDFNDFEVGRRHALRDDQHPRRRSAPR